MNLSEEYKELLRKLDYNKLISHSLRNMFLCPFQTKYGGPKNFGKSNRDECVMACSELWPHRFKYGARECPCGYYGRDSVKTTFWKALNSVQEND